MLETLTPHQVSTLIALCVAGVYFSSYMWRMPIFVIDTKGRNAFGTDLLSALSIAQISAYACGTKKRKCQFKIKKKIFNKCFKTIFS